MLRVHNYDNDRLLFMTPPVSAMTYTISAHSIEVELRTCMRVIAGSVPTQTDLALAVVRN